MLPSGAARALLGNCRGATTAAWLRCLFVCISVWKWSKKVAPGCERDLRGKWESVQDEFPCAQCIVRIHTLHGNCNLKGSRKNESWTGCENVWPPGRNESQGFSAGALAGIEDLESCMGYEKWTISLVGVVVRISSSRSSIAHITHIIKKFFGLIAFSQFRGWYCMILHFFAFATDQEHLHQKSCQMQISHLLRRCSILCFYFSPSFPIKFSSWCSYNISYPAPIIPSTGTQSRQA